LLQCTPCSVKTLALLSEEPCFSEQLGLLRKRLRSPEGHSAPRGWRPSPIDVSGTSTPALCDDQTCCGEKALAGRFKPRCRRTRRRTTLGQCAHIWSRSRPAPPILDTLREQKPNTNLALSSSSVALRPRAMSRRMFRVRPSPGANPRRMALEWSNRHDSCF